MGMNENIDAHLHIIKKMYVFISSEFYVFVLADEVLYFKQ